MSYNLLKNILISGKPTINQVVSIKSQYVSSYSLRLINWTTAGERLANGQVTGVLGLLQKNVCLIFFYKRLYLPRLFHRL